MKKMILFLSVLCVVMFGCKTAEQKAKNRQSELVARMYYFEDPRTHVCYSYIEPKDVKVAEGSHSVVPCDKVRALLPSPEDVPPAPTNFRMDDIPEDGVLASYY